MMSEFVRSTRRGRIVWALLAVAWLLLLSSVRSELGPSLRAGETETPPQELPLQVQVDPRVELLSIIFCFAGDYVYNIGQVESYSNDVQEHFGPFRNHSVVKLARELRNRRTMSADGPMSMAVHVEDALTLKEIVPFDQKPEHLDGRWTVDEARDFLEAARQFIKDAKFEDFIKEHQPLYRTTESRLEALLASHTHLEWFDELFGKRLEASYTVVPAPLNGRANYGVACRTADGKESLYCILGVWQTDDDGMPQFLHTGVSGIVVHEFCHSYTNRFVDQYEAQLEPAGRKIFPHVATAMKKQGYHRWKSMMCESLVRACTVRYVERYSGGPAALKVVWSEKGRQFLWIGEPSKLLAEYETHRDQYPTFDSFMPRIVTFFDQYAENLDR
ncbi:DUF4932 domain-containing protein [Planctomycetota bacterium]